jgi:uncharacterized YigZ family protein
MALVPIEPGQAELEEKKSRFLALIYPLSTLLLGAKEKAKDLKVIYKDQRHVVHAYRSLGGRLEGASDDGEPSGTAGPPILDFLRRQEIEDVAVFVIRWFGGIKLGPGGLVRAYTNAAQRAWEKTPHETFVAKTQRSLVLAYGDLPVFEELEKLGLFSVLEKGFTTQVTLLLEFPEQNLAEVERLVQENYQGRYRLKL